MNELLLTITELGVDRYTLLLIIFLPIIATIVAIARHIVGSKLLSLYAPIVLTYAFIEIAFDKNTGIVDFWDGIKYGVFLFVVVFLTATAMYKVMRQYRLHYFPKMGLIFTGIATALLGVLIVAATLDKPGILKINIFSIVLIAAVSEKLISTYAKSNFKRTALIAAETLLLAIFNFWLISIPQVQQFILENVWVLLVIVGVNIYVGMFRGLRLREYFRFYSILNQDDEQKQ